MIVERIKLEVEVEITYDGEGVRDKVVSAAKRLVANQVEAGHMEFGRHGLKFYTIRPLKKATLTGGRIVKRKAVL